MAYFKEAYGNRPIVYAGMAGCCVIDTLAAAHDPALDLQRSVCLADVVETLRTHTEDRADEDGCLVPMHPFTSWLEVADFITERFGKQGEGG
jgi:hypothetical protein